MRIPVPENLTRNGILYKLAEGLTRELGEVKWKDTYGWVGDTWRLQYRERNSDGNSLWYIDTDYPEIVSLILLKYA